MPSTFMSMPVETLHDRLCGQALVLTLLARVFSQSPDATFIGALVAAALYEDWPLPTDSDDTLQGLAQLRAFGATWEPSQLAGLCEDYDRLFIGPGQLLAPPWESVYRSKEGLIFEEETLAVRAAYARFGLRVPHLNREPDDHIGYELAFMARLSQLAQEAIEAGDAARLQTLLTTQRSFLEHHVTVWAGACLERVIKFATTAYFRGMALAALGTLKDTAEFIAQVAEAEPGA